MKKINKKLKRKAKVIDIKKHILVKILMRDMNFNKKMADWTAKKIIKNPRVIEWIEEIALDALGIKNWDSIYEKEK